MNTSLLTKDVAPSDADGFGAPPLAVADAHRRRNGPYTAAGAVARVVVPEALGRWPELVHRHDVELLTVAPDLAELIPFERATLTSSASPEERTRFYPRARTRRIAHGLVDFLNEHVTRLGTERTLVISGTDEADATDVEWITLLQRRACGLLRVVVTPDQPSTAAANRRADRRRRGIPSIRRQRRHLHRPCSSSPPMRRATPLTAPACTMTAPRTLKPPRTRRAGSAQSRTTASTVATRTAPASRRSSTLLEHNVLMGFYHAVIEVGRRCLALLRWEDRPEDCWLVVAKVATALTALDRADEAAELYDEACARSTLPSIHLQAAYGRAMLYTRFYDDENLDHQRAKAHINTAIAISSLLPPGERRAFNLTFNENGLALIEMHLGDSEEALRLVSEGLDRIDRELGPDQQTLHRSVLRYNQAQLLARLGQLDAALDAYGRLIDSDPHHSEYHFERAALHRRGGDVDAAVADYEAAIRWSPPYPEPHYNLGDVLLERGEREAALAHFERVVELEPTFVDAYLAQAGIRQELGQNDLARDAVHAGLAVEPGHPELLCLAGVLALDDGDRAEARRAFDAAIDSAPELAAAWANRAILAFASGDFAGAADDLSAALEHRGDRRPAHQSSDHL